MSRGLRFAGYLALSFAGLAAGLLGTGLALAGVWHGLAAVSCFRDDGAQGRFGIPVLWGVWVLALGPVLLLGFWSALLLAAWTPLAKVGAWLPRRKGIRWGAAAYAMLGVSIYGVLIFRGGPIVTSNPIDWFLYLHPVSW